MPSVHVRIEVPRGSFVKRGPEGIEYVSPVPCPFNYGSVVGTLGEDGDPLDAIVLGGRLPVDEQVTVRTWGTVRFVDDGKRDDKLICGAIVPSPLELRSLSVFFRAYAPARRILNALRGRGGPTRFLGIEIAPIPG